MRIVRWLHISDLHMREAENAQRHAVLSAMLENIGYRSAMDGPFDFVVVTGDLAFSGKRSEYVLVAEFLNKLAALINLSTKLIFCVPGNHDVQRERSKMCFKGAREALVSESDVYRFLSDVDERDALLLRQEEYRKFEADFLNEQEREYTDEKLSYVSLVEVDDLCIAIMGLNSSWLSEGGVSDDGKLLIGESQVKSAIDIAVSHTPHVVLGLQHHPYDLLRRFDRRPVQHRMEGACHFVHCGYLHDPEVKEVVVGSGRCITITAGASFESRVARNTYTTVELDPLAGKAQVAFIQYNPQSSAFEYVSTKLLDYSIDGSCKCTITELANAIDKYCKEASGYTGYLASLLLGFSSDVPMMLGDDIVFINWDSIDGIGDEQFKNVAAKFRGVGRVVRLLHGRKPLEEILGTHGDSISDFLSLLKPLVEKQEVVKRYVSMQNDVGQRMNATGNGDPLRHTMELLEELVRTDDWDRARDLAERTMDICDGVSRVKVSRILALCLARSTETRDKVRAVELYQQALDSDLAEASDCGALATLMVELERCVGAKKVIKDGVRRFPNQSEAFMEAGMRVVEMSGDRKFRDWLMQHARGNQYE
ncbi:MAG: metallophosphoesterase [Gammaproteobacteria bacterium]|nr:metallophosphoesterase [Gammaproteobacteria bacterium]MYG66774.1 metallophosphoesterase [Gammaproteobacteria bacterium]